MKKKYSEIVCVVDRSGSMGAIVNDAIGGFNTFLKEQKKVKGEATLTYAQFDTEYEIIHENKPLKKVPDLTDKTYQPRGATALLDAVGKTINEVGKRIDGLKKSQQPKKVIFAILTDGEENSSREFKREQILEMIKEKKEKLKWEFIFLAANQDAIQAGMSMGIQAKDSFNFDATKKGVRSGYGVMSNCVSSYRR